MTRRKTRTAEQKRRLRPDEYADSMVALPAMITRDQVEEGETNTREGSGATRRASLILLTKSMEELSGIVEEDPDTMFEVFKCMSGRNPTSQRNRHHWVTSLESSCTD